MLRLKLGKHFGKTIDDIPLEYLDWITRETEKTVALYHAEQQRREAILNEAYQSMAALIIRLGYRALSKELHPDVGGSPSDMQELNAAMAALKEAAKDIGRYTSRGFTAQTKVSETKKRQRTKAARLS